jgi:hypothetical protein
MAYNTARRWLRSAECNVEHILSVDQDDKALEDYYRLFKGWNIIVNENRSAVDAINEGAKISQGRILIVISDDFDCPAAWGKQILDTTVGKRDWIMKTPDGIQKRIITLPIMDRSYYNRFGYIYFPEYRHMWADTELTDVAEFTGRLIRANIPFEHNHYSIGKNGKDEVSIRADATYEDGKKLYNERKKHNFYLPN